MAEWFLLDLKQLFEDGAGTAGATTSANVGAYEVPLGPVMSRYPTPSRPSRKDWEVAGRAYDQLFRKKRRKK